jgi:isopentenyl diphosphate isomerase/L-lactate dehydrogenase-like FMN-dependent dehydrogenase
VNVFDFAKLAKAKLDPLAWDYLDEGSDDEASLRANRSRFDNLIIRPHFLLHDVASIDTSISLFGHSLPEPFYLSVTGGKNCFIPNGEQETALAAGSAKAMMITNGGISVSVAAKKGASLAVEREPGVGLRSGLRWAQK